MRPIVHLEDLPDDARIAAKAALPVGVAQHEHGIGAVTIVTLPEGPARHRPDAEEIEVVPRDNARRDAFRLAAPEQHEPHVVILDD